MNINVYMVHQDNPIRRSAPIVIAQYSNSMYRLPSINRHSDYQLNPFWHLLYISLHFRWHRLDVYALLSCIGRHTCDGGSRWCSIHFKLVFVSSVFAQIFDINHMPCASTIILHWHQNCSCYIGNIRKGTKMMQPILSTWVLLHTYSRTYNSPIYTNIFFEFVPTYFS